MTGSPRALSLSDIADTRAYEREREEFRAHIIGLKKVRRVAVGPVVSLVFENRETIRFQVQEMARAERLLSDHSIQNELDTYNPLIPGPGQLSCSLYVELTSRAEMEHWLPRLVGIERSVEIHLSGGTVRCQVEEDHAGHLTRPDVTAAVHFVRFELAPAQIEAFRTGPVVVAIAHDEYRESAPLGDETRVSLLEDLFG